MSEILPTHEEMMRKALFTPCETKSQLARWVRVFLGIHLVDCTVSEESNSNPMDLLWEIYSKSKDNDDESFNRVMAYAARATGKTLVASILELLQVLHLGRNVAHLAAIFDQSKKSQEYVRDFFNKPYIRDFRISQNVKKIEVTYYKHHTTGSCLPEKEWIILSPELRNEYKRYYNYIQIVLCTLAGANGAHCEFMCVDETDVIPKQNIRAYEEAKHIPAHRDGMMPITLLTSTRKFSYGLVQQEITNAPTSGLKIRHWNTIDVTEACKPDRHRPDLPKVTLYTNDDTLKSIVKEDYDLLDPSSQDKFKPVEAFAGCVKCPLFNGCKTRLATHQKSTSPMLNPISTVINIFKTASLSGVQTQILCRKPDASGLIYPKFNRDLHMKSVAQIAELITGEPANPHITKAQLLQLMFDNGAKFYAGMDFGFSHNFAVVLGAVFGKHMIVLSVIAAPSLELDEKIAISESIKPFAPTIFGDVAYPADIKTFKRRGFNMKDWSKYPGSVKAGIEIVRMKLQPANGDPQLFFLADDSGCELLAARLEKYHFTTDAGGHISEEPDDDMDDECFTDKTEVLTQNRGWVSLADVTESDTVMAVDSEAKGSWEHPLVIKKNYTGIVNKAEHTHMEWTATEDHGHLIMSQTDWKKNKTKRLGKKVFADFPTESYWLNNLSEWQPGPGVFKQGPDEAWMAGFWLAEGCFDTSRPSFLIVDQTKQPQQDEIRAVATKLNWTWSETLNGRSIRFVFSSQSERAAEWRQLFGALSHGKKLQISTILAMTQDERSQFWEGYMAGDGSRTGSGWHFDSVSKALVDGMQVLTLTLGYGCRIVSYDCMAEGRIMTNPQGNSYSTRQSWRGHVLKKEPVTHLKKNRIKSIPVFDLPVYCVRTTKGGFLARTNGKIFVAGNCDALRYMVMNVFAPKGKIKMDTGTEQQTQGSVSQPPPSQSNWMTEKISSLTGESSAPKTEAGVVKRGKFFFDG